MDKKYRPIGLNRFFGGQATDKEMGSTAQFYDSRSLNFRAVPSSFTLLPKPRNADGGVVVDLVQDVILLNTGEKYAVGDRGYIYKVATNGVWSVKGQMLENDSGGSLLYRSDLDHVYVPGVNTIARIKRVSTDDVYEPTWFTYVTSTCSTCTASGGTNTYTTPIAISESTEHKRAFTTDIEPLHSIGVLVDTKGTGNWTLTLHDDVNNTLATSTISNASLSQGNINYFTFSTPIDVQRGDRGQGSALTYHYHITSTVADGKVTTTTINSLTDCDMSLRAYPLKTTKNGLHPTMNFLNYGLIGNGRYVVAYEPLQDNPTTADYEQHRLTLPPGFEVCGFAQKNLMAIIAAEKRADSGEVQEGALFFWDGTSTTWNDFWLTPEGSPEAIFSHQNVTYYIAGGALYRMRGSDQPIKIRTFRNTESIYSNNADSTHVYPNMMTVRRGVLLIGYPSYTTNVNLEHGVYSLGAITREYPESFGFSYNISTGSELNTGSNNLKIGTVKNFGDTLYISWRDDDAAPQHHSVDVVDNSSVPAATGRIETLVFDDERPYAYKRAGYIISTFEPLPTDTTLKVKYRIDEETSWTYGAAAVEGDKHIVMPIDKTYRSIAFGVDLTCDGATSPEVKSITLFTDLQVNERPIGG